MKLSFLLIPLLLLGGCFRSEALTKTHYEGIIGEQVVSLDARGTTSTNSGLDMAKVVNAAIAGVRGDFAKALDEMRATRPEDTEWSTGEIATAGGGVTALITLITKLMLDLKTVRKDSDEAWNHIKEQAKAP
jgi:hypothetical protein